MSWRVGRGFMGATVRWFGEADGGKKVQSCKRQKGRDGGVQTHRDFRGAERQSIFYTNGFAGVWVSDQVGSVYLSINRSEEFESNRLMGI
jgi:hypothetical protein